MQGFFGKLAQGSMGPKKVVAPNKAQTGKRLPRAQLQPEPAETVPPRPEATAAEPPAPVKQEPGVSHAPMPPGEANKMANALQKLAKSGSTWQLEEYKACKTQQAKRTFFYDKFSVDPKYGKASIQETHSSLKRDSEDVLKGWMSAHKIAKLQGFDPHLANYTSLCKAVVEGLPSKPNPNLALEAAGEHLYYYEHAEERTTTANQQEISFRATGDLDPESYTSAVADAETAGPRRKAARNLNPAKPKAKSKAGVSLDMDSAAPAQGSGSGSAEPAQGSGSENGAPATRGSSWELVHQSNLDACLKTQRDVHFYQNKVKLCAMKLHASRLTEFSDQLQEAFKQELVIGKNELEEGLENFERVLAANMIASSKLEAERAAKDLLAAHATLVELHKKTARMCNPILCRCS